jgi:predicted DNA-binding ribbon-helix-helix protein
VSIYSITNPNQDMKIGGAYGDALMKSSVVKRSIMIDGHKTSVSLEDTFWNDPKEIAQAERASLSALVAKIDETRGQGNLSSAIRLFVLEHAMGSNERKNEVRLPVQLHAP